ncbi:hypothetical protein MBLNU13_g11317t1 [Cladosporium sp. NU13]
MKSAEMYIVHLREKTWQSLQKTYTRIREPSSWALPKQSSSNAPEYVWVNADQDPIPPHLRTWACLLLTQSLITFVAAICNAVPTVLNGAIGADLHIPFPIASRASFGYWLSYFCVVSRGVLALFWFGVQSAYGGQCVTIIVVSVWPSYAHLSNRLPESAGITTQGMISYGLYCLVQLPFLLVPTHKLQYLFYAKTALVIPTALATVIWITVKAGQQSGEFFHQPTQVHGSQRAWLWISAMTSITGGYSTLAVNIMDFSRFSKSSGAQLWQLPTIPLFKCIIAVFGVLAAAAAKEIYGEVLWSPLEIMMKWQDTPGGRAAAFLAGFVWFLAQISTNISANSIPFGNDITALAPRWFDIRRGVIFAAIIGGWAMCPWIIIKSATTLLSFLSAYALFMAPIAGILFCDYWMIKRKRYDVSALYDPKGIYLYNHGINWRALVTMVTVIVPLLPGMVSSVSSGTIRINVGLNHLFDFNWLYGFTFSIAFYWTLNVIWPHRRTLIAEVVHGLPTVLEGLAADANSEIQTSEHFCTKPSQDFYI